MTIRDGRFAAEIEGDFVVFLIGMRINHLLSSIAAVTFCNSKKP